MGLNYQNERSEELLSKVNSLINQNIEALIFDCDGTLVDSMPLHMKAWEIALNLFNAAYIEDYLNSLKGMKETEIIEMYNEKYKTHLNPKEIVSKKHQFFMENIKSVKPLKSIVKIAKKYFGKLPLAVVSGSVRNIVHGELEVVGIFHLFNIILTANDSFKPKPSPDIFLESTKNLNVVPDNCLVFEDGDPGLEAAASAGMKYLDVREYIS